jgi:hypothetical protein
MLYVTNGDSAVQSIQAAGYSHRIIAWRDVLHEGPVPSGLDLEGLREIRAAFLSSMGWTTFEQAFLDMQKRDETLLNGLASDEVLLWFEHDLYDQLQLLQILDLAANRHSNLRLGLICTNEYVGSLEPSRVKKVFDQQVTVSDQHLDLAVAAWAAFRSDSPVDIETLLSTDTSALPFLNSALIRHLEQFPSTFNGLSRSEQQALEVIAEGTAIIKECYLNSHHKREEAIFLGDTVFAEYLAALSKGDEPLVLFENGEQIQTPSPTDRTFWDREVQLTENGRLVLEGKADRVSLCGIDRWYGGVHIFGHQAQFRWDAANKRLAAGA